MRYEIHAVAQSRPGAHSTTSFGPGGANLKKVLRRRGAVQIVPPLLEVGAVAKW